MGLIINYKKSAILCIKGHKFLEERFKDNKFMNFPIQDNYTYLGIEIDQFGTIGYQLRKIK